MNTRLVVAAILAVLALGGCVATTSGPLPPTPAATAAPSLNQIARDYVELSLEIGTHEDGYIDAYYGPADLRAAAESKPRDLSALRGAITELRAQLAAQARLVKGIDARRIAFLNAQLLAADTRLAMLKGEKFAFTDEAERLFGVRPQLKPLSAYNQGLDKIAELVPGDGPLAARVDAYLDRFTIAKDRLKTVMDKAIAACRTATALHIAMPTSERFMLEFVTGKSWSGYNFYKGDYVSLIQINADFPIRWSRAVDLGCHEGYPGHHALNMLLEERLARGRGWEEFSVYPLYSPQSFIAEGTANFGIDMAFPGRTKLRFEHDVLLPLAGLIKPADERFWEITDAIKAVSGARLTIAQMYLDGEIDRERAVALTQQYLLMSPARADQSIKFTETYRSYVINYGLGQEMVATDLGHEGADPAKRWRRFEALISEPSLPSDLRQ